MLEIWNIYHERLLEGWILIFPGLDLFLNGIQSCKKLRRVHIARDGQVEVFGPVELLMVGPDLLDGRVFSEVSEGPSSLDGVARVAGVDLSNQVEVDHVRGLVFHALHLGVDDSGIVAILVDVMDLGEEVLLPKQRVEDVVQVDGQDVEESGRSGGVHCVTGVIRVSPSIGSVGQASIGHQIQNLFVGIFLAGKEAEVAWSYFIMLRY